MNFPMVFHKLNYRQPLKMPPSTRNRLPPPTITLQPVEGAFINLTQIDVDNMIAALLSYGPNFIVPGCSKLVDVIGSLEKLHLDLSQHSGVPDASQFIKEIYNTYYAQLREALRNNESSYMERLLLKALYETRGFFLVNRDLCIVQADKGQRTVLMYKEDYKAKMRTYIEKCKTKRAYVEVTDYDTKLKEIEAKYKELRQQLMRAFAYVPSSVRSRPNNPVPFKIWRRIISDTEFRLPALYGTIKCHKEDKPVRPICANHSWFSNPIQGVICEVLKIGIQSKLCKQNVRNISDVVPQLHQVLLCEGYEFVKYDVRDMYGSIDKNSVYDYLVDIISDDSFPAFLPTQLLKSLIRFSLYTSNILEYDGVKYSQVKGLPQGARDSGLYATIYLDHLIQTHYSLLFNDNQIVYWWKYMDDFLVYVPKNRVLAFKSVFERVTSLELEVEYEESSNDGYRISFLDINIYRRGMRLETCMYQKPCASMRMINYLSACMPAYKYNTIINFIKTILMRVTNIFLQKDLEYLERKLYANGYPQLYTRKYFLKAICKEIKNLRNGKSFLPMRTHERQQRVLILEQYLQRFVHGTKKLSAVMRRTATETRPPQMPNRMSVYNFCSIELSRFLSMVSRHYNMPTPVFRRPTGVYTAMRAVTAQGVSPHTIAASLGHESLKVAVVTCADCRTVFLISGHGNIDTVYDTERQRQNSDMWRHVNNYGHRLSPTCHILPQIMSMSSLDLSHIYALYTAMYNSAGVECNEGALRALPEYMRTFFSRLSVLPNVINLGLPMPSRSIHRN